LGGLAFLIFDLKPDGRLESRYQLMGLMEGLVAPAFTRDHFQLTDFTPFHDEIRKVDANLLVGRYVTSAQGLDGSLGILHGDARTGQFGFYYTLTRLAASDVPTTSVLAPFLDAHLPDGIGMTFDEEMVGWYFEGASTPGPGRAGDLTISDRVPGQVACNFRAHMMVRDINEFIEGLEHEAGLKGTITFDRLQGAGPVTFAIDEAHSLFNYLRVNAATGEAEMRYHIAFRSDTGKNYALEGRKYMQHDPARKLRGTDEVLENYTTLYCHVYEGDREIGTAYLKFRTFENLAAVGNLAGFLASFAVTGTPDPILQLRARLRFLAFTGQFVQREYDPLLQAVTAASQQP